MTKILVYLLVVGMEVFGSKVPNLDKYLSYLNINAVFDKYIVLLDKHLLRHALFNSLFGFITIFFVTALGLGIVQGVLYIFLDDIGCGLFTLLLLIALFVSHSKDNKSSFVAIHERLFGIIFWFLILGWFGALLYWFTISITRSFKAMGVHANFVSAAEKTHAILAWVPARITGLIFALAGNFSQVSKPWASSLTDLSKPASTILDECGNAATEGKPMPGQKKGTGETIGGIAVESLLQRAAIIWCVLGILLVAVF